MTFGNSDPSLNKPFNAAHFEALPHAPCVSLFHRTGRVGCGTFGHDVMTGRLLDWRSVADFSDSTAAASAAAEGEKAAPYVAVMDETYYTSENVAKLQSFATRYAAGDDYGAVEEGGPLRGVLVLAANATSSSSSDASPAPLAPQGDTTPAAGLTVGPSYEWNANDGGDGLTMVDFYGLPQVYVRDAATAAYLRGVAAEQSASLVSGGSDGVSVGSINAAVHPSIVSQFNYYMGPGDVTDGTDSDETSKVYTSQKCLEWKNNKGEWSPRCAPLGGNSVWSVAGTPLAEGYGGSEAGGEGGNGARPTVLLATAIDATSMFHDLSPGANTAASNTLALLLAAQLLGAVDDDTLDGLYGRIAFGFFQGESYGYLGSRRFLKDLVQGFQCAGGDEGVPSVYKRKNEEGGRRGCLRPMRADLTFQNLGEVSGMIAVDQVGNLGGTKNLYVQGGDATDANGNGDGTAGFLAEVLVELAQEGGGYAVQASSVVADEEDETVPLPPTPLSSLVKLSDAAVGGVVLTGYDDAFVTGSLYHSHLDSVAASQTVDKDAVAAAATLLARTAVAAAYRNPGDGDTNAETAAAYAMGLLPDAVDSSSTSFADLYNCLFEDGNCETFLKYSNVERTNDALRTGIDLGLGVPLGTPPSYYTSIYDSSNGQAFLHVGGTGSGKRYFGSLVAGNGAKDKYGKEIKDYGTDVSDTFLLRPSLLETSIHGILNDFLGRGSFVASDDSSSPTLTTCKHNNDCSSVSYCGGGSDSSSSSALASLPTCAGGSCVCGARSHYHPALDEGLSAAANVGPGMFELQQNEDDSGEGVSSALYTEPYWSSYVGVRVYNDAGSNPGVYASSVGAVFALLCAGFVWNLKKKMMKEKVY